MPASVAYLFDRITVNPRQCGGRPCIRGMRIRVICLKEILTAALPNAIKLLRSGESVVEITGN
ncbi:MULTISPECIES: DUF433 domain-containing protein [unclassified Microcoleus]|uniref:DUF433 domain-containing protein n=1 Tax=unclassified Microcoleus TaxID=2642155 RepID=UPI001DC4FF71|nr:MULTISPECIES: DUF433 domain-containing protein [unclassified Microcoleus]MCC3457476.1 DUF433 domain-containing protein [Microcoleus sp. PH2017_08_TRC_O_A]MCC3588088.1 DUF433 domain-containing protein [Microcoleus sp. PH2017_30_WIL_O_A]